MKISAMVLVGENEPWLKFCVDSIKDIVDEIIYVTEREDELYMHNDKKVRVLAQEGYKPDYSAWRNQALAKCTGDYVLVLDADEILAKPDGKKITRKEFEYMLSPQELDTCDFYTRHFIYNYFTLDGRNNGIHWTTDRLYKRNKVLNYVNKMHEHPTFLKEPKRVRSTAFIIWHFGGCKNPEHTRMKYSRCREIALKEDIPFAKNHRQFKSVNEMCAQHELFRGTIPMINYFGSLPECMGLW